MDLTPLRHEITFGMNRIYLLFGELGFTPTYYTCVNELVLQQFRNDISALPMPKFLGWNQRALYTDRDDLMFLRTKLSFEDSFDGDPTSPICSGGTVTYVTLQLAYFMGFREVILIGVDHRFTEPGTPNQTLVREAANDPNHFHPNYFPRGSRWQYPDLKRSEHAYALARDAFSKAGGRVLDATLGGDCRVFEKVSYDRFFPRASTAEKA